MEHQKSIINIPYWIAGMLERNNLPVSAVLDYGLMSSFLSLAEQANMLNFQHLDLFNAKPVLQGDEAYFSSAVDGGNSAIAVCGDTSITQFEVSQKLNYAWRASIAGSDNANNNALNLALQNAESFSYAPSVLEELAERLNPLSAPPQSHTQPFITYDVARDVVLVVVYPSFFNREGYKDNTRNMLVAVLKVLYAYNTYASVCKTQYFRKYLETLA